MDLGFLIFYHVLRFIQGIIGFFGNLALIVIIRRIKSVNNSHVIIWCIAVADFLSSIIGMYQWRIQYFPEAPSRFTTSKWNFWLYILGVQLNFYQNITEICVLISNKVLGMAIYFILNAKHLAKICQLE